MSLAHSPYSHQAVKDLAWVIASPALITKLSPEIQCWDDQLLASEFAAAEPLLAELDQNPKALLHHLGTQNSARLGHYFEALLSFWFQLAPHWQLLHQNLPIKIDGRTRGEADFILHHLNSGKIIHLEVTLKFYLCHGDPNLAKSWWGPNLQDCLAYKLSHLSQHQTQLSQLFPKAFPSIDEKHCLIKGRLFYPDNLPRKSTLANPNHLTGHYYQWPNFPHHTFSTLSKKQWLTGDVDQSTKHHMTNPEKPIMCQSSNQTTGTNFWFCLPANESHTLPSSTVVPI